ncbi:glycine betaine ABC transporter substrate-binding protein [Sulfitobacter sp. S190]|uniref:glycine betaine ABC transporter substrate-binding protein n=1 Tax=Sulfitobacter sp. S190 TaxID=2867022 RepID=UPI0021A4A3C3|nr:glycine betaine ABC transporter substrate-binding protein [Sulfitobacter sp. S190]UWR24537.1 hypothetical protein K3756_18985 [Sulfitobacter sp. S190]
MARTHAIRIGQLTTGVPLVLSSILADMLWADGHSVEITCDTPERMFAALGAGRIDILCAALLPHAHAHLFSAVAAGTTQISAPYDGVCTAWVVPAKMETLSRIDDLAGDRTASRTIRYVADAPLLAAQSVAALQRYELEAAGFELSGVSQDDWIEAVFDALRHKRRSVFALLQPHWTMAALELRALQDSRSVFATPDRAVLLAHRNLRQIIKPQSLRQLAAMQLTAQDITEMERMINMDAMTTEEVAELWFARNQKRVLRWGGPRDAPTDILSRKNGKDRPKS